LRLKSLHIYPVKACRGVDLTAAKVLPRGLEHDRRWMIVDKAGQFLSQRNRPKLAELTVSADDAGITLHFNKTEHRADIPMGQRLNVTVWKSTVNALAADKAINAALSDWLGETVRLVYMDAAAKRPTSQDWAPGHETSFADGYPVLVVNSATLDAVNDYIIASGFNPVTMARFRPNVVIQTDEPYSEDKWSSVSIGDVALDLVKPCTRCQVTTLDPRTGAAKPQPVIAALQKLRMSSDRRNKGVLFGVNAVVRRSGRLQNGQSVTING
jgi:uncharacterized protein YcbX